MNKEQLEAMSDLEINRLVCEQLPVIIEDDQSSHIPSGSSSVMVNDIVAMYPLDFCNNPADMMPLVFENGISLTDPDSNGERLWIASKWFSSLKPSIQARSTNPLRATAIVYLLMMEQ